MTPEQRRRADQIISVFENETLEMQYGYTEELGDGRGLTAGRAGFTTATGDLVLVVQRYVDLTPDSPLKHYLPRLMELAETEDGSTEGLDGLSEAWEQASDDPLFRTAARQLGARVVGVVLSGALSDGTFGLSVVKHCGGVAIVQDPDDALISAMPLNALKAVAVDYVLPAREIGETIVRLSRAAKDARRRGGGRMARPKAAEPQRPSEQTDVSEMTAMFGAPSGLTCPDCGGALWEVQEGRVARYQCHVGHQYAPDNLGARQRDVLDQALWGAVRVLEEQAELKTRMARGAGERKLTVAAKAFAAGADDARELARNLRSVLFDPGMSLDRRASRGRTHARRRNAAK